MVPAVIAAQEQSTGATTDDCGCGHLNTVLLRVLLETALRLGTHGLGPGSIHTATAGALVWWDESTRLRRGVMSALARHYHNALHFQDGAPIENPFKQRNKSSARQK